MRTSPNAPNASTIRSTVRETEKTLRTVTGNTVSAMPWWSK